MRTLHPIPEIDTMKHISSAFWAGAALALIPSSEAYANDAERIAALEAQLARLTARLAALEASTDTSASSNAAEVKILARKLELKEEETAQALPNTPVVTAGEKGFALASRDGAFNLKLRALIHFDAREYFSDDNLPDSVDTFTFRRLRPILEGTVFGIYDFRLMPDFTGSRVVVQDAYVDARFAPFAKLRVGKFKTPVGLERLQSVADVRFVERGLPTNFAPNRDLGIQLHGEVASGVLGYQLGIFNGVLDGGSSDATADADNNGKKDLAARIWLQPFLASDDFRLRGLGFGLAATHVSQTGSPSLTLLPSYRSPGLQPVFGYRAGVFADGQRTRLSPQFSWYYGTFGLLGEHISVRQAVSNNVRQDTLTHTASQLSLNWVLTGEEASYRELKPRAPFALGTPGWGALELVARAQRYRFDGDSFAAGNQSFVDSASAVREANAWTVGLNWYFNRQIKLAANYEYTRFSGGAPLGLSRDDEKSLFTRMQLSF